MFRHQPVFSTLLLAILISSSSMVSAQSLNGVFDKAIDASQKKMVKVFGAGAGRVESYATGMIVSENGLIITRQGVFLEGNQVRVITADGKTHAAAVLKRNRELQAALIKIPVKTPDHFKLTDKMVSRKGDWVVALSNAFKVADKSEDVSATLGCISLRSYIEAKRNKRDIAYKGPVILIDCITSNPGAAGGAVVNADGDLVGMIGTIIKSDETNTRLNYAVPSETLKKFVEGKLEVSTAVANKTEKARKKADLGIRMMKFVGKREPPYADKVIRNSPAYEIGIRPDDLIVSLNGKTTKTIADFHEAMAEIEPGKEVIIIFKKPRTDEIIRVPLKAIEKK